MCDPVKWPIKREIERERKTHTNKNGIKRQTKMQRKKKSVPTGRERENAAAAGTAIKGNRNRF